jgi:hypothetical protein
MNNFEFCHNDPAFIVTAESYLTGHAIHVNIHATKFLVPPTWIVDGVMNARQECRAEWAELKGFHRPSPKLQPLLGAFSSIREMSDFCKAVDALFAERSGWGRNADDVDDWGGDNWRYTDKTRIMELMVGFWRHDVIAWPIGENPFPKQHYTRTHIFGAAERIVSSFMEATHRRNQSFMRNIIVPLLLQRVGVREAGDLTADVVRDDLRRITAVHHRLATRALLTIQRATYGDGRVTDAVDDFVPHRAGIGDEDRFTWVSDKDPALATWQGYGTAFLAEATANKRHIITALNLFFKYLLANSALPREPRDYFDIRIKHEPIFTVVKPEIYRKTAEFLDWVLDCHLSDDVDGVRMRSPMLRNPLTKARMPRIRQSETVREAMPTMFVQMLLDILAENDWAWTKQFAKSGKVGGDWFFHWDKTSGRYTETWSPVRAVVLWLKLRMPFRTFQIRMLDSGEADTFIYNAATGRMEPNEGPLRTGNERVPVRKGVLQLYTDKRIGHDVAILRINTNKTADIDKAIEERGYDCPYAPADVVRTLAWLRDWQITHNPIASPTPWASVPELVTTKTAHQLQGQASCFLFRNPVANASPTLPIASSWIQAMWAHLLRELETRLSAQGILCSNGTPYKLVDEEKDEAGRIKITPRYDLHSLRVTLITAFYEAGVPVEVLMKIVGHTTIVMTLYYAKLGVAFISEQMEAGYEQILRQRQENWVRHQQTLAFKDLRNAVAWNEEVGPSAFSENTGASFVFMDIGVCPVACSKCDIGGPKLTGDKTRSRDYAPVPGGRANCACCRFIVTGPPFLHGLVAHFNAKSLAANESATRRAILERRLEQLDAERRIAVASGQPFLRYREWQKAGTDLEDITDRLDQLLLQMNALARLIEQSRRILAECSNVEGESPALIINDLGAIETAFEETSEFDLADRICQSSTFFEAVDPTAANVRRMRAYDRMLVRNGLHPAFLDMDEATSLHVGNQLSRLLTTRVGRTNTLNLLEGKETLARLGFGVADLAKEMSTMAQRRIRLRPRVTELLLEGPDTAELETV